MRYLRYVIYVSSVLFLLANSSFRSLIADCFDLRKSRAEEMRLDSEHESLQKDRARLLSRSDEAIERIARNELNMAKPGELEFRFPPPKKKNK